MCLYIVLTQRRSPVHYYFITNVVVLVGVSWEFFFNLNSSKYYDFEAKKERKKDRPAIDSTTRRAVILGILPFFEYSVNDESNHLSVLWNISVRRYKHVKHKSNRIGGSE